MKDTERIKSLHELDLYKEAVNAACALTESEYKTIYYYIISRPDLCNMTIAEIKAWANPFEGWEVCKTVLSAIEKIGKTRDWTPSTIKTTQAEATTNCIDFINRMNKRGILMLLDAASGNVLIRK